MNANPIRLSGSVKNEENEARQSFPALLAVPKQYDKQHRTQAVSSRPASGGEPECFWMRERCSACL
jgi:hypothetical protein